jgi:hypothetical protein
MDQIGRLLQQYAGASPQQPPGSAEEDFDRFAGAAPEPALAQGVAEAFRSNETPPFAQMVSQLFAHSDGGQRVGLLNTLLGAIGPEVAQRALGPGMSGLGSLFGGGQMTPEQASQIPPEAVEQMAAQAERQNPSVVEWISGFYAQHPALVKTLGAGALTAVLAGLARGQRQDGVLPASRDPYGDPADQGAEVLPASQDPYGDPADTPRRRR